MKLHFTPPVSKPKITEGFGNRINPVTKKQEFHNGIDLSAPVGTVLKAPENAIVAQTYTDSKGGNQVILEHPRGYRTGYAHLSKFLVKQGDVLNKGDIFALTGMSGQATGPHLHFTAYKDGKLINPETLIKINS